MINLKSQEWQGFVRGRGKLTHHIHPACIPSSLRGHVPFSLSLESQTDRARDREGQRREKEKERETDGETLRRAETECSWMCVVTCTQVCVRWMPKKSGTTDITPSAERRRGVQSIGKEKMWGGGSKGGPREKRRRGGREREQGRREVEAEGNTGEEGRREERRQSEEEMKKGEVMKEGERGEEKRGEEQVVSPCLNRWAKLRPLYQVT